VEFEVRSTSSSSSSRAQPLKLHVAEQHPLQQLQQQQSPKPGQHDADLLAARIMPAAVVAGGDDETDAEAAEGSGEGAEGAG